MSQRPHLGLINQLLEIGNLSPDLVFFADEVMDTLGQLLLRTEISSIYNKWSLKLFELFCVLSSNVCYEHQSV